MTDTYHTEIRKQLYRHGYHILPNVDKRCMRPGWADPDYLDKELTDNAKRTVLRRIERWETVYPGFRATGVRIEDGLTVIDSDVDDPDGEAAVLGILKELVPQVWEYAPTRFGSGHKFAVFGHTMVEFGRITSRDWQRPGDDAVQRIEIFGGRKTPKGRCSRQFGIYGPHSFDEDGAVRVEYSWDPERPALYEVPLADLPALTEQDAYAICDAFDAWAKQQGWHRVETPTLGDRREIFDITEETRFDTDRAGRNLTYEELSEAVDQLGTLRCSSSFMEGRVGTDPERCWVFRHERHHCAAVFVYGDETIHLPADAAPADHHELAELLRQVTPAEPDPAPDGAPDNGPPPRPDDKAELSEQLKYLLATYGYCSMADTVVRLYEPSDDCQMKVIGFQRHFRAWSEETTGPRGGVHRQYATGAWELHAARKNIRGVRLRPDRPFPLYAEDGELFKNTYRHPVHSVHKGAGDVELFAAFLLRLLPDPVERDWFIKRLAHKWRNPGVPGVAIVMVAANDDGPVYGCGRGLLSDILIELFGWRYVQPVPFSIVSGASGQSDYTSWGAYATWVVIDEAKDTPDSGRWSARRASYEKLKELVDPRVTMRMFTVKKHQAFTAPAFASYFIASNHRDALQLAGDDRRFVVLSNGEPLPDEMRVTLAAWMKQPDNIARLARWLEAIDLEGFDVYQPIETRAKHVMKELSRSDLDEAFAAVRKTAGPQALFTGEMLREAILVAARGHNDRDETTKRTIARMVKERTRAVDPYRTSPASGRLRILTWRDNANTNHVADSSAAQARAAATDRRLQEQHVDTFRLRAADTDRVADSDADKQKDE